MPLQRPLLLVCDVQERFRSAIYGFDHVTNTIVKMLQAAKIMNIPTLATEQNPRVLGATIPEIDSVMKETNHLGATPKMRFSMVNDQTRLSLQEGNYDSYILMGIESHVCVLQTALDLLTPSLLLSKKAEVYVLADAVSSCNPAEIPIALRRIERAGGVVTTSESLMFQLLGDADDPKFKAIAALIKAEKGRTKEALEALTVHPQR